MTDINKHFIVLDVAQADILWQLDRAWADEQGESSVFGKAARDISAYGWDLTLSRWEIPATVAAELPGLLAAISPCVPEATVTAAAAVIDELQAVASRPPLARPS